MAYSLTITFVGEKLQEARLFKLLQRATEQGEVMKTLSDSFGVEVISANDYTGGLEVSVEAPNNGKAFVGWACKQCNLRAEVAGSDGSDIVEYVYPESKLKDAEAKQSTVVNRMDLESQPKDVEVKQSATVNRMDSESQSTPKSGAVEEMALQRLLQEAREEGIKEGKFQIVKHVLQNCDTLDEMRRLTGLSDEEFVELANKFEKRG